MQCVKYEQRLTKCICTTVCAYLVGYNKEISRLWLFFFKKKKTGSHLLPHNSQVHKIRAILQACRKVHSNKMLEFHL